MAYVARFWIPKTAIGWIVGIVAGLVVGVAGQLVIGPLSPSVPSELMWLLFGISGALSSGVQSNNGSGRR